MRNRLIPLILVLSTIGCGGGAPASAPSAASAASTPAPAKISGDTEIPITVTEVVVSEADAQAPNTAAAPTPAAAPAGASVSSTSPFVSQKRALTMSEAVALVKGSKGSVVFFHLYASWCGPCRHEFPDIIAMGRRYGPLGVKIVAVSLDDNQADLDGFLTSYGALSFDALRMQNTSDQEFNLAMRSIDARFEGGIPYTAVYDRTGRKVTEWTGSRDLAAFESIIQPLL
jgi:thiol-disulfide isomerase/thioredoxin